MIGAYMYAADVVEEEEHRDADDAPQLRLGPSAMSTSSGVVPLRFPPSWLLPVTLESLKPNCKYYPLHYSTSRCNPPFTLDAQQQVRKKNPTVHTSRGQLEWRWSCAAARARRS